MQEQISKIELILENCEVITISGKYIGSFEVNNLQTSIRRTAINSIDKVQECESFVLSVYRDANVIQNTFLDTGHYKVIIFDRIHNYKDITAIEVHFTNGKKEYICMPWCSATGDKNIYQKSYMNSKGDIFLVIGKGIDVEAIWGNDETEGDFIWAIYGV